MINASSSSMYPAASTGSNPSSVSSPQTSFGKPTNPQKKFSPKLLLAALAFILVMVGLGTSYYLTQYVNQDVRQQASGGDCTIYPCGAGYRCDRATSRCVADVTQSPGFDCTRNGCGSGYYCDIGTKACKAVVTTGCTSDAMCGIGNKCVSSRCVANVASPTPQLDCTSPVYAAANPDKCNQNIDCNSAFYKYLPICSSGCFVAGTQITMADGTTKNIENVKVGDTVRSYDESTNTFVDQPVLQTINPIRDEMITIGFSDGTNVTNTVDHPYFLINKGWGSFDPDQTSTKYGFTVSQMAVGDEVLTSTDKTVVITSLQPFTKTTQTYNLSHIANTHTFFANGKLVHNKTVQARLIIGDQCYGSTCVCPNGTQVSNGAKCNTTQTCKSCLDSGKGPADCMSACVAESPTCGRDGNPPCSLLGNPLGCKSGFFIFNGRCVDAVPAGSCNVLQLATSCAEGVEGVEGVDTVRCQCKTTTSDYGGLTAAEFRRLSDQCVAGIDLANKRCLPYQPTKNGELSLGSGSNCQFSSQCASGVCSGNFGVCTYSLGAGDVPKPKGDPNAYYKPQGEVILTGNKDVTLIRDINNTVGTCKDTYDCAVGYHCSGNGYCAKDSYTCASATVCPAGWSCTGGVCDSPDCSAAQKAACGGRGCILSGGKPICISTAGAIGGTGGSQTTTDKSQCKDGSGKVTWCASFNCPQGDTNGDKQCTGLDAGYSMVLADGANCAQPNSTNGCWQVDYYRSGTKGQSWDEYCGHDGRPDLNCGGGVSFPAPSPSPSTPPGTNPPTSSTPSPSPVGPQCISISFKNLSKPNAPATQDPKVGDTVQFTCGTVAGAARYKFRMVYPGTTPKVTNIQGTGAVSEQIKLIQPGKYQAQCTICTGADDSTCQPFEAYQTQ